MGFKKLALVTAIAAAPMAGFAMDAIQDETLSGVTGQDGLSVVLAIGAAGIQSDIYIHDKDGLNAGFASYSYDAAIVVKAMQVGVGGANITINIDAGDNAATTTAPILNVNVALPAALTISTGSIMVANSERDQGSWGVGTLTATILNNMTIILGGTTLNIQLGNEQQTGQIAGTDMIVLSASVTGGLLVSGFRLSDATAAGDGGIGSTTMTVKDNAGAGNLTLAIDVNATDAGLVVGLGRVGSATGMDINIVDQYLGTSTNAKLGDVSIVGLNLNGSTMTINGK